jgi:hypothetical protein
LERVSTLEAKRPRLVLDLHADLREELRIARAHVCRPAKGVKGDRAQAKGA